MISEAAFFTASAAAQGVLSASGASNLAIDGKWGSYSDAAFTAASVPTQKAVETAIAGLTEGQGVDALRAYRARQRQRGSDLTSQVVKSMTTNGTPSVDDIRLLIIGIAGAEGVPVQLALRIAYLESKLRHVNRPNGASGALQVTPIALKDVNRVYGTNWTMDELRSDPTVAITAGVRYIKMAARYIKEPLNGDEVKIYVAYNIGAGSARAVLSGNPEAARKEIAKQWYGGKGQPDQPSKYLTAVIAAIQAVPASVLVA